MSRTALLRYYRRTVHCAWMVIGLHVVGSPLAVGASNTWEQVQQILAATDSIVVFDGTELAPLRCDRTDPPVHGDWIVQHMLSDPESLNPYTSSDAGASRVLGYIFDTLLYADNEPPHELRGRVARGYPHISEDKLEYTFELREDVRFSDGTPLTAADVVFSMKTILNPRVMAPFMRNYYATVQDVRKDGPYRVTIVCDEPYFRNDVALGFFQILPRHFYDPDDLLEPVSVASLVDGSWEDGPHAERVQRFAEQFNQGFNRTVMGSGPYMIEDPARDVVTQQKVVLTRNPDYWGTNTDATIPAPGYVDRIVFNIINNTDAAFIELTNGNLDFHTLQPLEFREKSWSSSFTQNFLKGVEYSHSYVYIGWNNRHPIFRDQRVRRAMSLFTDKTSMIEGLLFGLGEAVVGPIHRFRPEYNHDLVPYQYDPYRALDKLFDAGWDDTTGDGWLDKEIDGERMTFRFEILINSGNQIRKDIALALQGELRDFGIDCQVRELDWSIFLQRVRSKEFDAVVLGWTGGVMFPPDAYQVWHSSQSEASGSNYISYSNDEVDAILEAYRQEFDPDRRIAMYQRFQEILHEEQPYTFLWMNRVARAYSRRFTGVNWYPTGADVKEWWVTPDDRKYQ